ncbi:MFS transporter [Negadavirga shengliensis]|uniref:MFS transporter n=1 Tax=Negadavirga shengliensis TaxID=1389218 RepID=A0ABV9SXE6_9BACT
MNIVRQKEIWGYRWRIMALLFFATTINYLDRHVLSILAPDLQQLYGWSEIEYGYIVTSFQLAYGIGVILTGKLLDRWGVGLIYALAIAVWSLAGMGHALARSAVGFMVARFFLGLGESANFPAAIKTVAEWFPKKERALATGLFNAGSNVGAIISPLLIPVIALKFGWQWAFIGTGVVGFLWLIAWLYAYRKPEVHPKVSELELNHIHSDQNEASEKQQIPWKKLLTFRSTYVICLARFMTDPVWWFFLYWLPKFFNEQHGINLLTIGPPLVAIYLFADVGSVAGGWFSSHLIKTGMKIHKARMLAMAVCAICVIPVIFAAEVSGLWVSVAILSLATAAHCGWMANMFTLISDFYPKNAVASVVGLSTFAAVLGSMLVASAVGFILETTGSYYPIFFTAGFMYLLAWMVLRLGLKKIELKNLNP